MKLDERKIKILEAIINDYIKTAEPVGSRTIVKKYDMGISSATIRNEMADLEDLGLIVQPHTSSGRIPSDEGYRLYVDQLSKNGKIDKKTIQQIRELFKRSYNSLDNLIKDLSGLVSYLTKYPTIVSKPHSKKSTIKYIQLLSIDIDSVLLITVINRDVVKNNLIKTDFSLTQETLDMITGILNQSLDERTLEEINLDLIANVKHKLGKYMAILDPVLEIISNLINEIDQPEYYTSGITNILDYPEFNDASAAKDLIDIIQDNSLLPQLIQQELNGEKDVVIRIGKENEYKEIKDCSLITCRYEIDGDRQGLISIIGPRRMDYSTTLSLLQTITEEMSKYVKEGKT